MAITIDGASKRIILDSTSISASQIWSAWVDWHSTNTKWPLAFYQTGGNDLGGGLYIPPYFFLLNGWRVRPMEAHQLLIITGNLMVLGGGQPVVQTIGNWNVSVQYTVPVQAQAFSTSGSTGPTPVEVASAVWNSIKADPWNVGSFAEHIQGLTSTASAVYVYPDAITRVIGSDQGGTIATILAHDDSYLSIGEIAGQGLEVQVQVSSSVVTDIPQACRITGYYAGSVSHSVTVQAYNYVLLSWEEKGIMLSRNAPFDYSIPLSADNHDGTTGEIIIRFVHSVGTYINSHRLHIDFMEFELNDGQSLLATDLAAIKNKTDQLAFSMGKVNSNMQSVETTATNTIWNVDPATLPDTGIGGLIKKIYTTCKNIFSLSA